MEDQLNQLFKQLLSPITSTRNQAESQIKEISANPIFEEVLLSILASNLTNPSSTNLLQSIYLKNYVYENLNPYHKELNTSALTFGLKDLYLQTYYKFDHRNNLSIKIKHNLNLIIVRITEFLYPDNWPLLLDTTVTSLTQFNDSPDSTGALETLLNTLYILKGIFTYYLEDTEDQDCADEALLSSKKYLNILLAALKTLIECNCEVSLICISLIFKCIYRLTNQVELDTLDNNYLKFILQKRGLEILTKDPYSLSQLLCNLIEHENKHTELVLDLEQLLYSLEINNKTLLYLTLFVSRFNVKLNNDFLRRIFESFVNIEREDFKEIFTFFNNNNLDTVTGEYSLYNVISNDKIELESICLDKALKMTEQQLAGAIIKNSSLLDGQFNIERIKEQIKDLYNSRNDIIVKLSRLDISLEILSKTINEYLSLGSFILEISKQNSNLFVSAFIAIRYCSHITFNKENFTLIFNLYSILNSHLLFMVCFASIYPKFLALNLIDEQQKESLGEVNFLDVLNLNSLKVFPLLCNDCHKVIETLLKANLFSLDNMTITQNKLDYLIKQLKTITAFIKDITEQEVKEYSTVLTTPVFYILGEILCILVTYINKLQPNNIIFEETNNVLINFLTSNKIELDTGYTSIIQCLAHLNSAVKLQSLNSMLFVYKEFPSNWATQKGQLRLLKVLSNRLNCNDLMSNENIQKLINAGLEDIHLLNEVLSLSILLVMKINDPISFTVNIIRSVVDFIQKESTKTNKHTHGNSTVNIALLYFSKLVSLIGIQKLNEMMESIQNGLFQEIIMKIWLPNIDNFKCVKKIDFEDFVKGTEIIIKGFNESNEKTELVKIIEKIKIRGAKVIRGKDLIKEDEFGEGEEFYDLKTSCVK